MNETSLLRLVIGFPVAIIIVALLLKLAIRLALKLYMPFLRACLIVICLLIPAYLAGFLVETGVKAVGWHIVIGMAITLVINFFVGASILGAMVKPNHWLPAVGFRKGMRVWLVLFALVIVMGVLWQVFLFLLVKFLLARHG